MNKKTVITIITLISVVCVAAIVAVVLLMLNMNKLQQHSSEQEETIAQITEQLNYERQQQQLALADVPLPEEVDSIKHELQTQLNAELAKLDKMTVENKDLKRKLDEQKARARQLLAELDSTKATDAKRIAELTAELNSVRRILMDYVRQVDELNQQNRVLHAENTQIKQENAQVKQHVSNLSSANRELKETVQRAKQLDVISFQFTPLNKRDKKTRYLGKITKLQFDYTIGKNISTDPGMKTVYIRLTDPTDRLLGEEQGLTFSYEGANVPCSLSQQVEYTGENCASTFYWSVPEGEAVEGTYRVQFFCDGHQIGEFSFVIEK